MNANYDVMDKTGLKMKGELDALFGVSRVSLFHYRKGTHAPGKHTAPRINAVIAILEGLVERGKLPFKEDIAVDAERRKAAVKKLQDYVDAQRLVH